MNEQEIITIMQTVPLFQSLAHRQLQSLAKLVYEREYPAGETIVKQGEGGVGLFVIISGSAEAVRERSDGSQMVVNTFGTTDFFGELALLDDGQRTASVITTAPTKCLGVVRWDFQSLLRTDAEMAVAVLTEMARRFRQVLEATL
jgi:CRP/FNR family transcriptional regulator, cyclic AMP receptor protein